VFYRSPSPDDPPFVNVGDVIYVGQTVGLIEAMKVYSELPSEVSGRIVEIVAENGKLVKQAQPLFYVEPV
jgi:acetyl-CoA carboxylase biotin carboxyl carrier protein